MMYEINVSFKLFEIESLLFSLIVNKENSIWYLDNKKYSKILGMVIKKLFIELEW